MDLLFFHRILRRLVLIELKLGEFELQDKGQTELYLRWLEKYEKAEGEEGVVGECECQCKGAVRATKRKGWDIDFLGLIVGALDVEK